MLKNLSIYALEAGIDKTINANLYKMGIFNLFFSQNFFELLIRLTVSIEVSIDVKKEISLSSSTVNLTSLASLVPSSGFSSAIP